MVRNYLVDQHDYCLEYSVTNWYTDTMDAPFFSKQSKWQKIAALLHLTHPKSPTEKFVNTFLHLLLYISLIAFGYLLGLLQFAE